MVENSTTYSILSSQGRLIDRPWALFAILEMARMEPLSS
jgi:hypothetical protein